ncbi:MAG TPA: circularly permuted type 2 ATP-grasp protein [Candidatus Competibacteraceae bacterium]|nr:circularly permuted type 2 ATP-grasp protein [Candidatus Competibacteraceae bacterium]
MAIAEPRVMAAPAPSLFADYAAGAGGYDELRLPSGELRPHWAPLLGAFEELGLDGLGQRAEEVQRLLRENGVTFNAHDEARSVQRAWRVDPLPLLITEQEWHELEVGLSQRARLLDALIADLYGPREVIRRGLLPPELVYAHPGFLLPCHQSMAARRPWLVFHGVDLVRDTNGRWLVMADRCQAPSGAGYALENRIILARALPSLYRDAPLRRLASFLEAERATLAKLARHHQEQPTVALLTPGPGSDSYFEHAYLANYLSLSLVEGADLAVRDGRVWLKTLGGLKTVDVILRQVGDDWCDPLELRGDSLLGVPGLLQAVRSEGVALANALGCAVAENPGLLPFLPALCRHLLGEELRLPAPDTWWCGEDKALEHVLANLGQLWLRSIAPGAPLLDPSLLAPAQRAELAARIRANPELYVAQTPVTPATAPVLEGGRLQPRPLSLRTFCVVDPEQSGQYRGMPGGLAWVGPPGGPAIKSEIVKDVWVLAPAPQPHVTQLRQAHGPIVVTRDGLDLPSRVADNLFWLGRYGERLDGHARLLREALQRLLEQDQEDYQDDTLEDLLTALELEPPAPEEGPRGRLMAYRSTLLSLFGEDHPHGLPTTFAHVLRNGRAVRDHLGDDSWRVLNCLQQQVQALPLMPRAGTGRATLGEIITLLAAFFGLCNETMPHHYGWRFMDIGRFLERLLNTLDLLKLALITARNPGLPLWEVVLATTDNFTAYRRRYRSQLHPTAILDLLLFDEGNPRSVGYMLKRLTRQLERLPRHSLAPYRSAEARLVLQAFSTLQLADIDTLANLQRSAKAEAALAELLDALREPLAELSDAIAHSHFAHAEAPRQLIAMQAGAP